MVWFWKNSGMCFTARLLGLSLFIVTNHCIHSFLFSSFSYVLFSLSWTTLTDDVPLQVCNSKPAFYDIQDMGK